MQPGQGGGGGKLGHLMKDRKVQLAAAGVAAIGGVVWWRRKSAGTTPTDGGGVSGTPSNPANLNTVGSDVGAQLGQYGQGLQTQLDAYTKSLNDTLAALQKAPATDGGTGTTPTGLAAPGNLHDAGLNVWQNDLRIDWNPVQGATSYVLRDPFNPSSAHDVGNITGQMQHNLLHNGSYFFQVAAKDAAGNLGAWSPTLGATTKN